MTRQLLAVTLLFLAACNGAPPKKTGPPPKGPKKPAKPDKPPVAKALVLDVKARQDALAKLPRLAPAGVFRLQAVYRHERDALVLYLDVQLARGMPTTIAIQDALPVEKAKVAPFDTADRFAGKPWQIQGKRAGHARWPIDPLADLEPMWEMWRLMGIARGLIKPSSETYDAKAKLHRLTYPGVVLSISVEPTQVRAIQLMAPTGKPDGPPVALTWASGAVEVTHGSARLRLVLGGDQSSRVGSISLAAKSPRGAVVDVTRFSLVDAKPAKPDPFRVAADAYRKAAAAERGVSAAFAQLQDLFGPWVSSEFMTGLRNQAWGHVERGAAQKAFGVLTKPYGSEGAGTLDTLSRDAEARGHSLEALALAEAAERKTPTPARALRTATLSVSMAHRDRASRCRTWLVKGAVERIARVAASKDASAGFALSIGRILYQRPKVSSALLVGQIALPSGFDSERLDHPVSAADASEKARAKFDAYFDRVKRELQTNRADLGRDLDRLITALSADPAVPLSRLLLEGEFSPEQLQTHLRNVLAWILPARPDSTTGLLIASMGSVMSACHPRVAPGAVRKKALKKQLEITGPDAYARLLAGWLPDLSADERKKARRAFAERLGLRALNPLYPFLKWPVPGLSERLTQQTLPLEGKIKTPEEAAVGVLRAWGELELTCNPYLLARSQDQYRQLQKFLEFGGSR